MKTDILSHPVAPAIIAITPQHALSPAIAIAACRAGALGLLDLGVRAPGEAEASALATLRQALAAADWGVRCDLFGAAATTMNELATTIGIDRQIPVLLLAGVRLDELAQVLASARHLSAKVFLEVVDLAGAVEAERIGFDGLILKGNEAGGRVSKRSAFILAQECAGKLRIPYWIQGGIGLHSAAPVVLSGAAGIVLCEQLWNTAEAPPPPFHTSWEGLDGSETVVVGGDEAPYRCYSRTGRASLRGIELTFARVGDWQSLLLDGLRDQNAGLMAAGQDLCFAAPLAARFGTVGRIITALNAQIEAGAGQASQQLALADGAPLALAHGTRFPIAQGPMTRVSDVAPFAKAVGSEGALPFIALAVMRGPEIATMLRATRESMGAMPWGVGILGFMPLDLRQEQLNVLREIRPPFAVIAGGRPSQARELDEIGITTYLHVPSPGLLRGFLDAGARRFIFEGSECGGHTGPRSSFVLWQQAIDILATSTLPDAGDIQVMFAGGIHDALSAAMVATLAAPLVALGMKIGVLMGTAYLFTHEIVAGGAIVEEFQRQAVACEDTALLQSGVGIYTRCARTEFCEEFESLRRQLIIDSKSEEDTLMALELMNIGRLRIAAKGITRNTAQDAGDASRYVEVDAASQRREGLYMLGEIARLRQRTCSLAELHAAVAVDSMSLLLMHAAKLVKRKLDRARPAPREEIAIVGMACHFPRAQNLREYWQNIVNGVDAIREVSDDRWQAKLLFDPRRGTADKVYSKWGGFLDDIAFDPRRYGIAPATLASIEPAQLLTLEVARQALEDAGFDHRPFARERTACIMAVGGMNDLGTIFNFRTLLPQYLARVDGLSDQARSQILDTLFEDELPKWTEDTFPGILGNVVAGRIANRLDLGGSNFTVDAACAASLAALEVGIRQLRDGDADVALVGGVDCTNSPIGFMCFAQTHALSPRGRSRPFDASADGIAISEGVGVVVLKRLADAERDGDRIYALVKGIGSASDGRHRSLTAPHPPGQVLALRRAYDDAGIDPACVTLIEGHGTGTALGDRSEVAALDMLLGQSDTPVCALGSVKSMIGHTKVAAGMAGLIKGALALQHQVLPATIGVDQPASALQAGGTAMYINTETRPWLHDGRTHPRYCGVSAFGFGGTNFHAVMAEYTGSYRAADKVSLNPREVELFAFAAATREEIRATIEGLVAGLVGAPDVGLAQLAYSLYREQHVIRRANGGQPCRLVIAAASQEDLLKKLRRAQLLLNGDTSIGQEPGVFYRESAEAIGGVCFLFPGQGAQRVNMLRELVTGIPALQEQFADPAIAATIYPQPAFSDAARDQQQQRLNATDVAQPALGMVNMAAFEVLHSFGLRADCMAGHSYGEYVALCASGAISTDTLLRLSMARGTLCAQAPAGTMAAIDAGGEKVAEAIARHSLAVSVANLNAPDQTIIAGTVEAIEAARAALNDEGMRVKRLAVSSAFHCAHMDGVAAALGVELAKVMIGVPRVPVYTNVTAAPYPADAGQIRELLTRHIAEPVRFADEIEALYVNGARIFVECGPGLTLTGLVGRVLGQRPHTVLAIDAPGRKGWVQLAQLLSQAIAVGLPVDLAPWFGGRGLAPYSVAALFDDAKARAAPGPLTWRVNGGRAQPWHVTPQSARSATSTLTPPPAPAAAPTLYATNIQPRRTVMNTGKQTAKDEFLRDVNMPAAADHAAPGYDRPQLEHVFTQLLAFQSEQQQTLHRFFDFHAHMAGIGNMAPLSAPPPVAVALPQRPSPMHTITAAVSMPATAPPSAPIAVAGTPGVAVHIPVLPPLPGQGNGNAWHDAPLPRPVPAAVPPAAPAAKAASPEQFEAELLRAVSERTGYPVDMLDMDAHMEADLGIDSIKRIEIFSGLTQRHSLVGERDEETMIEELSGFKTLREVVAWYARLLEPAKVAEQEEFAEVAMGGKLPKKVSTPLSRLEEEVESHATTIQLDPVLSYTVRTRLVPMTAAAETATKVTSVILVGNPSALANALHERLTTAGHHVVQLVPGSFTRKVDDWHFEIDLSSITSLQPLLEILPTAPPEAGVLVNLMGWQDANQVVVQHRGDARALFLLLKVFGPQLKRAGGQLLNLTSFGGAFGLQDTAGSPRPDADARAADTGSNAARAVSAGTIGVAKTAAREWGQLKVKCIDAAPTHEPGQLADCLLAEMFSADGNVEIGYGRAGRCRTELVVDGAQSRVPDTIALTPESVVLVTGGAYGITAELTRALAEIYRPRLVLVGRSALPGAEPAATRGITDTSQLRQLFTAQLLAAGERVTPVLVDAELSRLRKERETHANLAALRASGCQLEYHSLDVRDAGAFAALIDNVYRRLGRIDGVLHGAGIISDKLIASKPLDAFDAVFDTKVTPALVLANALRLDALRFIVFFSSVAGRFGNIGQADYSAANEVLNKLASTLAIEHPDLHALALNWGPWDAGMVSDDLRRLYSARGIRPIPLAAGRRQFLDALSRGPGGPAELVISASVDQIAALRLAH